LHCASAVTRCFVASASFLLSVSVCLPPAPTHPVNQPGDLTGEALPELL
jgi:hypothetical protein